jgi:hypothetical protein
VRITREGRVEDAFAADSSGQPAIDSATLDAVRDWRYAPRDSDRCGVSLRLSLHHPAARLPRNWQKRVGRFESALAEGDLEAAHNALDALRPGSLSGLAQLDMKAQLAAREGDLEAELIALDRAAGAEPRLLGTSGAGFTPLEGVRVPALIAAEQYGSAARILRAQTDAGTSSPELGDAAKRLAELSTSTARIVTPGRALRLGARSDAPSHWSAPLLRDRFRIDVQSGSLSRIELCCDDAALELEAGATLGIPAGATNCGVFVRGEEGARFTLTEFPNETPGPAP